ncbi:MAG: pyridoxamine 5'-phosphate oxidase [Bacteroidetes bacterium]|nr:pyridoxamine 5'-phosphate oxidase [Bacteroidota bacterium]
MSEEKNMSRDNISSIRNEYKAGPLTRSEVDPDPIKQFERWFDETLKADVNEPTAMHVSTVNEDGKPSGRIMLLKGFGPDGFLFYTNYNSSKATDIEHNPNVSLNMFWSELHRQVRIQGVAEKISSKESDQYFQTRPRDSQIAAIASPQSDTLASRHELETKVNSLIEEYEDRDILRPENWGGYRVRAQVIEFWQGREGRLHDRIRYSRSSDGNWEIDRLAP